MNHLLALINFYSYYVGDGQPVSCCAENGVASMPPAFTHYACMPIMLEPDDEFYRHFHQGCINFVRSKLSPNQQCRLGYGRQVSDIERLCLHLL